MNGLKVRPCCIEVLEQVLNILKKHVSNDEKETELQSSFKCDTQPPPVLPSKSVTLPLHYANQNKNSSSSSSSKSGLSGCSSNSPNSINIQSQTSKNTIPLGFHFESHPHQNVTLATPSLPPTVRNRIPASVTSATQHSPPQSMVVVTNPPTISSHQNLKVTMPSPPAAPTYQQGQPTQTFSDGAILHLLREEPCPRNQFLFENQTSGSTRKVLSVPKNMDSSKEEELVPGLGVKIPEAELTRIQFNATSANDPAVLVIALLQYFFSDEVLARSTATSCRGKGRAKHSTARPLNQRIMQAIREFATTFAQKINRSLTETQVNRITANKIGTAKMALKRRQEDHNLSLHSPSRNKVKRHSTATDTLNTEDILNFSDEQLNFVIKVEKDEFNQPLS